MTRRRAVPVATVVAIVYAWWATAVPPFTARAYVAVGLPAVLLLVVAVLDPSPAPKDPPADVPRASRPAGRHSFPWLLVILVAAGLEAAGLALGGRSAGVPTLSTVVDHALAWHAVRFVLFCVWLAAGVIPLRRAVRAPERDGEG